MLNGKKIGYFHVLRTVFIFVMGIFLLAGCSGSTEGTIYLTGVSRLKLTVNSDGKVKDAQALNKTGSALLGESSWKGEALDTALDAIVPLLQNENVETVYVDVFSDDKTWETNEAQRLTEKYGGPGENESPVEVRRIKDIDSMEEVWNEEAVSAAYEETEDSEEKTAEEETSPQEIEEETSAEETSEEETETEETTTEAAAAPTTAARRTQPEVRATTAAARTTAAATTAASPETTAPREAETLPPEETLPQVYEAIEGAAGASAETETAQDTSEAPEAPGASGAEAATEDSEAAVSETAPEEAAGSDDSQAGENSTEEETTRSSVYIPPSEIEEPYGPGWTEEE